MKYLSPYKQFESVDLLIPSIDKYKPMVKLMADFLNLNVDERYNVPEMEIPLQHIYSTLHKIEGLFNDRNVKIGDVRYSLSAKGDNELNKLKEIKKIHIGYGESITFDPDLYFEDLKFIDCLLYKVEQGNYHVKIDPQYWDYGKTYQLPSNYPKSFDDHVIKNFKEILRSIENFYIKCKDIKLPNFTAEDIEDMLLEYLDNRTVQKLYVQGRFNKYTKISNDFIYTYQVGFILNIPNSIVSVTPDLEQWSADEATKIYKSCLSKFFNLMNDDYPLFVSNDWETKDYIARVNLKLVEK